MRASPGSTALSPCALGRHCHVALIMLVGLVCIRREWVWGMQMAWVEAVALSIKADQSVRPPHPSGIPQELLVGGNPRRKTELEIHPTEM